MNTFIRIIHKSVHYVARIDCPQRDNHGHFYHEDCCPFVDEDATLGNSNLARGEDEACRAGHVCSQDL